MAGQRACPPEDVGGPWGYLDFLAAVADPSAAGHDQWMEWVGDGFDSERFDLAAADTALDLVAWADLRSAAVRRVAS